jgi:hypothetical protein
MRASAESPSLHDIRDAVGLTCRARYWPSSSIGISRHVILVADREGEPIVLLDSIPGGHIRWMGGGGTRRIERVGERRFPYLWILEDCFISIFGLRSRLTYRDVIRGVDGQVLAVREFIKGVLNPIITQEGPHRVDRRLGGPRLWKHGYLVVSDADGDIFVGNKENTELTILRYVPSIEPLLAMTWITIGELYDNSF